MTYDNECFADMAMISIDHFGACEAPPCAAVRDLAFPEPFYCPGVPKQVQIHVNPREGATSYGIEDSPPAGWEVTEISAEGTFDEANWKVKWGPFFEEDLPRSVSYVVVPPSDATGLACFSGMISIDGANEPICGDDCIDSYCCPFMEVDLPQPPCPPCPLGDCTTCVDSVCRDGRIGLCELIGYACAWKNGCNDDLAGMTRAAFIWRNGECYCWDETEQNWFPTDCTGSETGCCDGSTPPGPGEAAFGESASAVAELRFGRASREDASRELLATIKIAAPADGSAMALEFQVPDGWEVTQISDDGAWDGIHRKVKWGPFMEEMSRTLVCKARQLNKGASTAGRLSGERRVGTFRGTVSFDGLNRPIAVDRGTR
jgi:hypothetical protein